MAREIICDPALERVGKVIVEDMKRLLKQNNSVDTGALYNSISFTVKDNKLTITMEDYGLYVNDGTRGRNTGLPNRKMPPIEDIEGWATRKGLNTWAVAKHIQMWGTKPKPFIESLEEFGPKFSQLLEKEAFWDISKYIDKFIKDLTKKQNIK